MTGPRCPGQDTRYWTPEDIFEVACPDCGHQIEFFKDDPALACRSCGRQVANPRTEPGCARWCSVAAECLGRGSGNPDGTAPW